MARCVSMIHLNAGNDVNGNPRRLYLAWTAGRIIGAWNEGYMGTGAVPTSLRRLAARALTIPTTVTTYRALLRDYAAPHGLRERVR